MNENDRKLARLRATLGAMENVISLAMIAEACKKKNF
jgi:hypothetical protein